MKRFPGLLATVSLIGLLGVFLFGCAPAPAAAPTAASTQGQASKPAASGSDSPIVIGLVTEVTGPQTGTGDNQTNAIKMAVDEWNAKGGIKGRQIKLVIVDDTSTTAGAVTAFNKVVADQKPVAVFVPNFANSVMAIDQAIKTAGIPAITGASGPGVTANGNPWIFRVRTNDNVMGELAAQYAVKDLGAQKIGILAVTGEMGAAASKVVKATAEKLGATVVATESYNQDDKDVTAQMLNIGKANADLMIGWSYPPDAALIMTSMLQLNPKYKLFGSPAYGISDSLKLAKEAANGRQAIVDWAVKDDPASQEWAKKIEERAKLPANFLNSLYYDGANMLFQTIEKVGTDPKAIQDGMRAIKGYKGISGEFNFEATGDSIRQADVVEIKNGKPVVIKTVKGQ